MKEVKKEQSNLQKILALLNRESCIIEGLFGFERFFEIFSKSVQLFFDKKISLIVRDSISVIKIKKGIKKGIKIRLEENLQSRNKNACTDIPGIIDMPDKSVQILTLMSESVLSVHDFLSLDPCAAPDVIILDDFMDLFLVSLYKNSINEFINRCEASDIIWCVSCSAFSQGYSLKNILVNHRFDHVLLERELCSESCLTTPKIQEPEILAAEHALENSKTEKLLTDCLAHSNCDVFLICRNKERALFFAAETEAMCSAYNTELVWQDDFISKNGHTDSEKSVKRAVNKSRKVFIFDLFFPFFIFFNKLRPYFNPGIVVIEGIDFQNAFTDQREKLFPARFSQEIHQTKPGLSGLVLRHQLLRIIQVWNKETLAVMISSANIKGIEDFFIQMEKWFHYYRSIQL
jgi:hypothetical protein